MKIFLAAIAILSILMVAEVHADPGFCDCFGGMSEDGTYWQLLDNNGDPLADGNWVYAVWVGPDGEIAPPRTDGYPGGDDLLLPLSVDHMEYSSFLITVTIWQSGSLDSTGVQLRPADEDFIYCRIFNGPKGSIGPDNFYADSQIHQLEWKLGDQLFCQFPGDPGKGHTDKPVPETTTDAEAPSGGFDLRQIYPNLLKPETRLEYGLPGDGRVSLRVFDLQGRAVRTLVNQQQGEGWHTSTWDGRDDQGQEAEDGIYYCRLKAGDLEKTVRVVLFR